ncbi:MAG: hypothetical protein R6U55_01255 [Desulfovermiculus sp.]
MSRWRRWPRYVPVAERRAKAQKKVQQLRKKGKNICPIQIEGRTIARSFWGQGWCTHLESFSDFSNRLPRGRTYVRNGSVCHLEIEPGQVRAMVSGSKIYNVTIGIRELPCAVWEEVKHKCAGSIGSMLELLQGRLSDEVMQVVTDARKGLFPRPEEISLHCDCPDWAVMCKHVAAVLYGVGHRLDQEPELLFTLRRVEARELISSDLSFLDQSSQVGEDTLSYDEVGHIFGIELDEEIQVQDPKSEDDRAPAFEPKEQKASKQAKTGPQDTECQQGTSQASCMNGRQRTGNSKHPKASRQTPAQAEGRPRNGKTPLNPPTGNKIVRLRKQCAQSAPEFAKRLNVSAASVYRWENTPGKLSLHSRTLAALRQVYAEVNGH